MGAGWGGRYIRYFKEIVYREIKLHSQRLQLYRINFSGVPIVDKGTVCGCSSPGARTRADQCARARGERPTGKCSPFLRIYQGDNLVFATATKADKDSIQYARA